MAMWATDMAMSTITTDFVFKYNATLNDQEKNSFHDAVRSRIFDTTNPSTTTAPDTVPTLEETAKLVKLLFEWTDNDRCLCSITKEEMKTTSVLIGLVGIDIVLEYEELKNNPLTEFASTLSSKDSTLSSKDSTLSSEPKYYPINEVKHQIQKAAALYNGKYTCNRTFKFMGTPIVSVSA